MTHKMILAFLSALCLLSSAASIPAAADEIGGDPGSGIVSDQPGDGGQQEDETPDEDNDQDQDQDDPILIGTVVGSTKFTCTADAVRINWTDAEGAQGYEVYRFDETAEDWALVETIEDGSAVSYRDSGLASGTAYRYKVRAYASDGEEKVFGEFSEEIEAQTRYLLSAPAVTLSNSANKITVKLTECENADGYFIYMSTKPNSGFTRIKATQKLSYTKSGLADSKMYYFKARAYKTLNGKKYYGEYTDVASAMSYKYIKAKKAADIYSDTSFASKKIGSVKAGKTVILIEKDDCWYKIRVGGQTGYIYNMAFGVSKNTSGAVTAETLPTAADDILFLCGATPAGIQSYVTNSMNYYFRAKMDSRDAMAMYAINFRGGACYYYAALCDYLLERLGYEHYIIEGSSQSAYYSEHNWNIYKTESGWRHLDSVPTRVYSPSVYSGWTDAQLLAHRNNVWDRDIYPKAQ